jgi:hypothetical protein
MPINSRQTNTVSAKAQDVAWINKHLIMGYLFLALVFAGAIGAVYYWETKVKNSNAAGLGMVESGEQIISSPKR